MILYIIQGCQWEVIKKHGTTFCGKPVCSIHEMPEGAKTEAAKELRERNIMSLYSVRNYLLGFR